MLSTTVKNSTTDRANRKWILLVEDDPDLRLVVRDAIENHYDYSYLAARIALSPYYKLILSDHVSTDTFDSNYKNSFKDYLKKGIELEMINPELQTFDIDKLMAAIEPSRDKLFMYLGIQIVIDRYLLSDRSSKKVIYELPQWFWMRVAMGLALKEPHNKEEHAISFYNTLSKFELISVSILLI